MQRSVVGLPAFVVTGTVVRAVAVLGGMPGVVWVASVDVLWIIGPALFVAVSAVLVVGVGLGVQCQQIVCRARIICIR